MYVELRERPFSLKPDEIGIAIDELNGRPYGLIMEFAFPNASITLVTFIDGNASIYLSTGGGIIGGYAHENVRNAVFEFIDVSKKYLSKMEKVTDYPVATPGEVIFYALTPEGVFKVEDNESKLQDQKSEFWELYYFGQNVITELRKTTEK